MPRDVIWTVLALDACSCSEVLNPSSTASGHAGPDDHENQQMDNSGVVRLGRRRSDWRRSYDGSMRFIEELHELIERRLQELRAEIAKIEDARRALTNGSAKPAATQLQPAEVKPRRHRQKVQVLTADQLQLILSGSADGLSTAAIAEQGHADPAQVLTVLRKLETAGQVRRSGERRGTRWHLTTDEDRVAERAAEHAARSGVSSSV